jgi:hypothetical protein
LRLPSDPERGIQALAVVGTYEQRLNEEPAWALREGSEHFGGGSAVHKTLLKITRRLTELRIPYVIAGGMALFFHGYRRFTEDVDIVVTAAGLQHLHQHLEGLGYVPLFPGSRGLRDAEYGVRIEFLVSGEYPGDGKPKPVTFPDPAAGVEVEGLRFLGLVKLVELKLASGTSPGRRKDLGDVQELIRLLKLSAAFADQLHPSVRATYHELWTELQELPPS